MTLTKKPFKDSERAPPLSNERGEAELIGTLPTTHSVNFTRTRANHLCIVPQNYTTCVSQSYSTTSSVSKSYTILYSTVCVSQCSTAFQQSESSKGEQVNVKLRQVPRF